MAKNRCPLLFNGKFSIAFTSYLSKVKAIVLWKSRVILSTSYILKSLVLISVSLHTRKHSVLACLMLLLLADKNGVYIGGHKKDDAKA